VSPTLPRLALSLRNEVSSAQLRYFQFRVVDIQGTSEQERGSRKGRPDCHKHTQGIKELPFKCEVEGLGKEKILPQSGEKTSSTKNVANFP
jgi:hypothetical protein